MSIDITGNQDDLIIKSSQYAWRAVSIHKMVDGPEKRKKANELGHILVRHILALLRDGNSDFAIEIGMNSIQMFYDAHNYHQVLSCIEGLMESYEGSRLQEDIYDYEISAKKAIKNSHVKTKEDKIDVLYNIIWENGCIGTTDALKSFKKRTHKTISEPTIVSYSKILKSERRILSFGGPTGRPIEMYPNNSISLNRKSTYNKKNFFEGNLLAKNNLFEPVYGLSHRKNANIYEVENGNEPRVFALIEPGNSISSMYKKMGGITSMPEKLGIEGKLHPIELIPDFGFKIKKDEGLNDADFLTECKIKQLE